MNRTIFLNNLIAIETLYLIIRQIEHFSIHSSFNLAASELNELMTRRLSLGFA